VTGNVLSIPKPRSVWNKYFGATLPVSSVTYEQALANPISAEGGSVVTCPRNIRYFKRSWEEASEAGNTITMLLDTQLKSLARLLLSPSPPLKAHS
jgi:hypothetical protein